MKRNLWIDYLRSAITVIVVAHHASLAYTTFARFDAQAYINSTHPVVDDSRWIGLDIFENFNDIFFMSLMFFIGGLFLMTSISKKGRIDFIKDRFYRLFLPFILGGTTLMLIAYFPSWYLAHHNANVGEYVADFFGTEEWPVGPPWFIWVLFVFNVLFALSYSLLHKIYEAWGRRMTPLGNKPLPFILLAIVFTWILYVPLAMYVGPYTWRGIGPFDFQLSRVLWYFGYFLAGVAIGGTDLNSGIFSSTSQLVMKWKLWVVLAILLYALLTVSAQFHFLADLVKDGILKEPVAWMIYFLLYVSSCVLSCIAFITAFRSNTVRSVKWWNALSENAYLIYLVHFIFITSTQFILLDTAVPASIKFLIVFLSSFFLSWGLSILLRRIPLIRRYL